MCPASVLQMHPRTTLIVDASAASRLTKMAYYQHVNSNKPAFQKLTAFPPILP